MSAMQPNNSSLSVAVFGLGIIGSAWAENLEADGVEVRVWNRTPRPQFQNEFKNFEPEAAKAAQDADVIILVVADPAAVSQVLEQIAPVLKAGQTVVQASTISAEWTLKFAETVHNTGAQFLEAPFTGSKLAAEARQTVFYIGGEAEVLEGVEPILGRISKTRLHIGPLGTASTLKLAMNMNIAAISGVLCESLTLARANGISDETFFSALEQNVAHSGLADLKKPKLLNHDYSPQFSIKHMAKDLRLALETAGELPLEETRAVYKVYEQGLEKGMGDDDFVGLIRLVEENDSSQTN